MKESGSILELLKNEYFVEWIVSPTQESTHYWSKWISSHQERKQDVETAIQLIKSGKYNIDEMMPEGYYDMVLENIVNHSLSSRRKEKTVVRRLWRPLSVAASVALVGLISVYVYLQEAGQSAMMTTMVHKEAPLGTKVITRLPDGSTVTLNSGSKITYPEKFSSGDIREVSLTGEAFFEVEHNPAQPFLVHMNGDHVRVLGTSFNIRSYPEDSAVYVSVATGRVSYRIPDGEEVILEPDQMATWLPAASRLSIGQVDRLQSFGWKDKVLYFNDATFDKIITEIERWYGVEISVDSGFGKRGTYSEEFINPTLSEVLHSLAFVYRFQFKIDGNKVVLNKITT